MSTVEEDDVPRGGPIAWMTRNHVAANLLMLVLLVGGILIGSRVKQEVFPEFELDIINVSVPYLGASPEEVEQGILLSIEERVRSLDGVKKVTAVAVEGLGQVLIELEAGVDANKALSDVKTEVDAITSFPEEAERPTISLISNRRQVITVVLYGDHTPEVLKQVGEQIRQDLLTRAGLTYVELRGVLPREIAIEVPQSVLRAHGITLDQIAARVRATAVELPGGGVRTAGGEVLVRTAERRDFGREFRDVPIVTTDDGSVVRLGDVAKIQDGFQDVEFAAEFDDQPAVLIDAFRSGDETPIDISDRVKRYIEENKDALPPGLSLAVLSDQSEMYAERVDLLVRNARLGLVLVLLVLGLFLNARLAFWVTMGIPISFLGSLLLLPSMDVSVNMISLFAFLITLGIVVDDAIVVGENIFEMRQLGASRMKAAIRGAQQIAMPVVFSVLTTVVAFCPLFFVPGTQGKFFRVIPAIVVCVLLISLVESLFILPAHLGHQGNLGTALKNFFLYPFSRRARRTAVTEEVKEDRPESLVMRWLNAPQRRFSGVLQRFIERRYLPILRGCLDRRYLTMSVGVALLIAVGGLGAGGHLNFTPMPKVDTDVVTANAALPFGSPFAATEQVEARLEAAARQTVRELGEETVEGIFVLRGASLGVGTGPFSRGSSIGEHLTGIQVYLVPSDQRSFAASRFAQLWREKVKDLPGLESLSFVYSTGPGSGAAIEVQISHPDIQTLEQGAAEVAAKLSTYDGVRDIDDGFAAGKPQLDFKIRPEAQALGLTSMEVGRQVRAAFFGAEAFRQQRGRDEVKVMVRRPGAEREREHDIESMLILTPEGGEIPLYEAAEVLRGNAYTSIQRTDGQRVLTVTADVNADANAEKVLANVKPELGEILSRYRGMTYSFEGESRRFAESIDSLKVNGLLALICIFALLAIPFRSYIQPLVVMSAIPFGVVGAVGGHLIMGYDLSLISIMGILALSGIVVNDSLVLVHAANARRDEGFAPTDAIQWAGARRLRPIVLTSLTTFFGLAPMIFETSVQARFLIPMAISLGFGVLFATGIILLLVPALYLIVEDAKSLFFHPAEEPAPSGPQRPRQPAPSS